MIRYVNLFFIVSFCLVLLSCSKSEQEIRNERNRVECLDFDFSHDSLILHNIIVRKDNVKYNLSLLQNGPDAKGLLRYNGDICYFWLDLLLINGTEESIDSINNKIEYQGEYNYTFDRLSETAIYDGFTFRKLGILDLISDDNFGDSILNIKQKIYCGNLRAQVLTFEHDGFEYEAHFSFVK